MPADTLKRINDKTEWKPRRINYAPIFVWPVKPLKFLKWAFAYPGFFWPRNVLYFGLAALTWLYLQPSIERCVDFRADWILQMLGRNLVLIWLVYGGWHLALYMLKLEGTYKKYNPKWPSKTNKTFLWNNQTLDNVFWTSTSGCLSWTFYEALLMWAYANKLVPYVDWKEHPAYFLLLFCAIPFWREFHFYWIHRAIHWKPLYRTVHYLHHKNTNPGPWSGLAMHPVESMIYFSCIMIHWIVPSHPIHMFFNAQLTALTPSGSHHGFEGPVLDDKIPTGSYFHYLHHKYFECNYGETRLPLDKWFGTFNDGSGMPKKKKAEGAVK